jgi:glutamine synthetase
VSERPDVDTVAVGVPTASGWLMGKRLTYTAWQQTLEAGSLAMPEFHLIVDITGTPVSGLPAAGAHTGWANGLLRPDLGTWRVLPWEPRTALVLGDAYDARGQPAETAPRWILRRQLERLEQLGLTAVGASELEFYLFSTTYQGIHRSGPTALRPAYHRHGDVDLLVAGHLEPVLGQIRRELPLANIPIELSHGEGGIGQFEVTLPPAPALEMSDRHTIYKHAVKTIAHRHGLAATFMAKVADDQAASGCHFHLSVSDRRGGSALAGDWHGLSEFGRAFLAGVLTYIPELLLLLAPFPNSYRRLQPGEWVPTTVTWGVDNRAALVRLCGTGKDTRLELRLAGADANPYLGFAAFVAAGLAGVEEGLEPPPPVIGEPDESAEVRLPRDIGEAAERLAGSAMAAARFGEAVRDHLVGLGEHEAAVARREVTDRDLIRGFETA